MREYFENQAQVIEELKNTPRIHFDKVDKNGTHVFYDCTCSRCGGTGVIPYYGHIDHGVCFKCGGSGVGSNEEIKVFTDEYGAKLKALRAARAEAKRQKLIDESGEWNKKWLEREGFNAEGTTYLVLGNTFEIKEELKANGAKFDYQLGWHIADPMHYDVVSLHIEQVAYYDSIGRLEYESNYIEIENLVKKLKEDAEQELKAKRGEHISEHIGTVGERRDFVCKLVGHFTYETHYSYYGETNHIYKFADENGDIIVWNTSSWLEEGKDEYRFKATIKEHSEYEGEKQTVVIRPKFI